MTNNNNENPSRVFVEKLSHTVLELEDIDKNLFRFDFLLYQTFIFMNTIF